MVTDEQLMFEIRHGSRQAFEVLFERHKGAVWRFFRRRVTDSARAEELVQDVFLAILQNVRRYEPKSAFRSYLFGIAYNLLLADRRKAGHQSVHCIQADMLATTTDPDAALWVRRALGTLDERDREILMLREYEELSYQEIADLLRIPLNSVRSRLFRARMELKAALSRAADVGVKGSHGNR